MSKRKIFVVLFAVLALCSFFAVGCADKEPPEEVHTVVMDANGGQFDGGDATKSYEVADGGFVSPATPTRTGYGFTGWYSTSAAAAADKVDLASTPIIGNSTYYAGWAITVTFNLNYTGAPNGGIYRTDEVEKGGYATLPAEPQRDGFEFVKWTVGADENSDEWTFSTYKVQTSMTLYAQWKRPTAGEVLTGITVTPPTKHVYKIGDTLDRTGMVVMAHFEGAADREVSDYTVSDPVMSTAGTKTVTVTYKGKTDTFEITVSDKELVGIRVTTPPTKTTYVVGQTFDKTGMVVKAVYDDQSMPVIENYNISYDFSEPDNDAEVTVTYSGKSDKVPVTVIARAVVSVAVTGTPVGKYAIGDKFNTADAGLTFTATYNDGTSGPISADLITYTGTNVDNDGKFTAAGDAVVTFKYNSITVAPTVTVTVAEEKPVEDGVYLIGSFSEWELKADYKASVMNNSDSLVYKVANMTFENGARLQFVRMDGDDDSWFGTDAKITVKPAGLMTVEKVTDDEGDTYNFGVTAYNAEATDKWSVEWVEKSGSYEIVFTLNNFYMMRDPRDPNSTTTASAEESGKVYLRGNFTDGYKNAEAWSELNTDIATKSGNTITFTKVYLKQYDEFKVVVAPSTWYGGTFAALGVPFDISTTGDNIYLNDSIENGFYNIVYTGGASPTLMIDEWHEPLPTDDVIAFAATGTLRKTEYYVDDYFSALGLTFTATFEQSGDVTIPASQVTFSGTGLQGGKFTAAGTVTVSATYEGFTATATFTVTVSEKPIPATLETGYYLLGTFNNWNSGTAEVLAGYKLVENVYDEGATLSYRTSTAVALPAEAEFKIVHYNADTDYWDWTVWGVPGKYNIHPAPAITLSGDDNVVVGSMLAGADARWEIEYLVKGTTTKTYEMTVRLRGYEGYYNSMRSPVLGGTIPTAETTESGDVYIKGNFTDEFKAAKDWSNKSEAITVEKQGNIYTFSNVYIKCFDKFKMYVKASGKWLGISSPTKFVLGKEMPLSDGSNINVGNIQSGYYDFIFDSTSGSEKLTVAVHVDPVPKYNVSFDKNISYTVTVPAAQTIEEGGLVTQPTSALKLKGFTFDGWFKDAECTQPWNFTSDTVTEETTLYAGWTTKTITIVYTNTDTAIESDSWTANSSKEFAAFDLSGKVGAKANYTFLSWKKGSAVVTSLTYADIPADGTTITLTASYKGNEYAVSFETEDGAAYTAWASGYTAPTKHVFGTELQLPVKANLAIEDGYTFLGWYKKGDESKTKVLSIAADAAEGGTYVIILEQNITTYTFSFDLNYTGAPAADPASIDVVENEKASKPAKPSREHYTFDGWFKDTDCTTAWNFDSDVVTKNTTVYAKWTPVDYTVSFDGNVEDGDVTNMPSSVDVAYGGKVTEPTEKPDREYYDFGGWYKDAECKTAWNFATDTVDGEVTLYAKWTLVKYDVKFNANKPADASGEVESMPETVKVERGSGFAKPAAIPTLDGYSFGGWYKEAACTTAWKFKTAEQTGDTVTAEVELFARWVVSAADGLYVAGTFNGWSDMFDDGTSAPFYLAPEATTGTETIGGAEYTTKTYVATGIDLASTKGDANAFAEFRIVSYSAEDGVNMNDGWYPGEYNAKARFDITIVPNNPEELIKATLYNNVRNIVVYKYSVDKSLRWTLKYVEKTKKGEAAASKFELAISPDGYNELRNMEGTTSGTPSVYLAGNFTGGFDLKPEWSDANTDAVVKDGNVYIFTNVPLKKYDTFKVVTVSGSDQSWLGGAFAGLDSSFDVLTEAGGNVGDKNVFLDTIDDGNYNVKVDMSDDTVMVTLYLAEEISVSLNKTIYVGQTPTNADVDVFVGDSEVRLANDKFTITAAQAVAGENANSIKVVYNGTVATVNYTATEVTVTATELTKNPTRTEYNVGDTLSLSGARVKVTYNTGATETVSAPSADITYTCAVAATGGKLVTAGENVTVEILYKGTKLGEISITVSNVMTSLTVVSNSGEALEFVQGSTAPNLKNFITVTANYNEDVDGATPVAPTTVDKADYNVSALGMNTLGDQTVTVTYGGSSVTGTIVVKIVAPTATAATASGTLKKTSYFVGDEFDPNGITVTVTYNNGKTAPASLSDVVFSSEFLSGTTQFAKAGTHTVTMTYGGLTVTGVTLTVTVDDKLTSITITSQPTKTDYYSGDVIDLTGMKLFANYNETIASAAKSVEITSGYTTAPSATKLLTVEDTKIAVSYGGFKQDIAITVTQKKATEITVGGNIPEQYLNSTLNIDGITITVKYNSGAEQTFDASELDLTFACDALDADDNTFTSAGKKTVTVTYDDVPTTFEVDVINTTKYSVEFFLNAPMGTVAGTKPATQQVTHGETATAPTATLTLVGYTFDGWYTEASCTNAWSFDNAVMSNKKLYVKWTAKTYDVTYELDGGENASTNPAQYTAVGNVFGTVELADASKDHYEFGGWYTAADFSGEEVTELTYAMLAAGDITLYAKFTPITYHVTIDDGTSTTVVDVVYNAATGKVAKPADPSKVGHTFDCWQVDGEEYDFNTIVTEDFTIVANFNKNVYTITFDSDGGSAVASQDIEYGGKVAKPADPSKDGYSFGVWQRDGATYDFDEEVTEAFELTATWTKVVKVTVTFDSNGGSAVSSQTFAKGGKATEPADPSKDGYTFNGWYSDEACDTEYMWDDPVTTNITLYAGWTLNTYQVTFNVDGGSAVAAATVDHGAKVTKPADPTKAGNVFNGWFKDSAKTQEFNFDTETITDTTTIYAKWTATDGIYVNNVFVKALEDNKTVAGSGVLKLKVENVDLPLGKVTFFFDGAQLKTNVYVRGGTNEADTDDIKTKMSGTAYSNLEVKKAGVFSLYYDSSTNTGSNGLWVFYHGVREEANIVQGVDGLFNASNVKLADFTIHEDGLNEVKTAKFDLAEETKITVKYGGAKVNVSKKNNSIGTFNTDGTVTLKKGTNYEFYLRYTDNVLYIKGEPDTSSDPNANFDLVTATGTGVYLVGTFSGTSWDKGFAFSTSDNNLYTITRVYLEKDWEIKVRLNGGWLGYSTIKAKYGESSASTQGVTKGNGDNIVISKNGYYTIEFYKEYSGANLISITGYSAT